VFLKTNYDSPASVDTSVNGRGSGNDQGLVIAHSSATTTSQGGVVFVPKGSEKSTH